MYERISLFIFYCVEAILFLIATVTLLTVSFNWIGLSLKSMKYYETISTMKPVRDILGYWDLF